jgi:hypothetical protein
VVKFQLTCSWPLVLVLLFSKYFFLSKSPISNSSFNSRKTRNSVSVWFRFLKTQNPILVWSLLTGIGACGSKPSNWVAAQHWFQVVFSNSLLLFIKNLVLGLFIILKIIYKSHRNLVLGLIIFLKIHFDSNSNFKN